MNTIQRKIEIMKRLEDFGHISVTALAKEFDVTPMTIRRDLKDLADQPNIIIEHGGARIVKGSLYERNVELQKTILREEKKQIARACLDFIHPGDCVYLGTGSTVMELAELLRNRTDIVIVTNSFLVVDTFKDCKDMTVIIAPGKYDMISMGTIGDMTNNFLSEFHFSIAFMSTSNIDLENGVTLPLMSDGLTRRVVIKESKTVVILADYTKFDKTSIYKACDIEDIDYLITDNNLDAETKGRYADHVNLICGN